MAQITHRPFGKTCDGRPVTCWTLAAGGYTAEVLDWGGVLRAFRVPAPEGARDIVLGCDNLKQYEAQDKYFGALVGRVANRIGGAAFELDGRHYPLAANNGPNCLHGGARGFNEALWQAEEREGALRLRYRSLNGEEGFPGTLTAEVTYALEADGALSIDYRAESDANTLCNLTNHSYFNLHGHARGSLEGHTIQILADAITEMDATSVPTGRLLDVAGTPFDLRQPTAILEGLASRHPQLALGHGYDHNFVLHHDPCGPLRTVASVTGGGLRLRCATTQPGLQFYTANFLDGTLGKEGIRYPARAAFCLETQAWPDAVHHPHFPSVLLRKGEVYRQRTVYQVETA